MTQNDFLTLYIFKFFIFKFYIDIIYQFIKALSNAFLKKKICTYLDSFLYNKIK